MKFVIKSISKCSGRLGVISNIERLPELSLESPLLLLHTKGGSIPHLGREVFDYLTKEKHGIEICVSSTEHMEEALKVFKKDIGSFCGLGDQLTFVTLKDPSEPSPAGYHEKGSVPIFAKRGKVAMTPERYMNIIEAFKPDFYHALCDGDTTPESSNKRLSKSVEKTDDFVKICVERHKNSDVLKNTMLIGPIEGGYSLKLREISIKNILLYDSIGGFLIDGVHTNGPDTSTLDLENLKNIVSHCQSLIPNDKLKLMLGCYHPSTVLEMIKLGIDIFDSTYPYSQAIQNKALTFNFDLTTAKLNMFEIDLSDKIYKEDFTPILSACKCLSCEKHTKAYIYHLIDTKELLAPILLMIHNLHHYLEYFKIIRQCVENDKLPELIELISSQLNVVKDKLLITESVDEKQKSEQ